MAELHSKPPFSSPSSNHEIFKIPCRSWRTLRFTAKPRSARERAVKALRKIGRVGVGNRHRSVGADQSPPQRPMGEVSGTLQVIGAPESAGERELKRAIR